MWNFNATDNRNREGRLRHFLWGPLTGLGVAALVALLMALGWLAATADIYLETLYEEHGGWAVRAVLLGALCVLLVWRLAAQYWPRR